MVNVYDTMYIHRHTNLTISDHLYLNPSNIDFFNRSNYLINNHRISILDDKLLDKLIKKKTSGTGSTITQIPVIWESWKAGSGMWARI